MASEDKAAFAIWVTGLPASGKSTLVACLKSRLDELGVNIAVLESDAMRRILTPQPRYDEEERLTFYQQIVDIGTLLTSQGVPVIFDATANRRRYRDRARQQIPRFFEIYVECPLETCMARDPKGIYRRASMEAAGSVPGLQSVYEPPQQPDVVVRSDQEAPHAAAERTIMRLTEKGYLPKRQPARQGAPPPASS